ncbi:helix-turn-helix domain-containing protein [Haloarchaeobius baliensis]|uniref:helix-turn-helix domain-containing protein n=1 Tax=Haloarchaeobius baliensis TaxID=1670458 RepID=UPI003F882B37
MTKLEDVDAGHLRAELATAETAKAAKRLMVGLAYKDGVGVETIASRYGIPQSTVYYWLDRFEGEPVAAALTDEPRPGRPSKLTEEQRATVATWLREPPDPGDTVDDWTAALLRDRIADEFGVDYSAAHVSRAFLTDAT